MLLDWNSGFMIATPWHLDGTHEPTQIPSCPSIRDDLLSADTPSPPYVRLPSPSRRPYVSRGNFERPAVEGTGLWPTEHTPQQREEAQREEVLPPWCSEPSEVARLSPAYKPGFLSSQTPTSLSLATSRTLAHPVCSSLSSLFWPLSLCLRVSRRRTSRRV